MKLGTHLQIDQGLNGEVVALKEGYARVRLATTPLMVVDEKGLVHGGFCFGAADFTAMAAVNEPFVVLAKSECKFLVPVRVGDVVAFEGNIIEQNGKKATVEVIGSVHEKKVFSGLFYTVVLERHVFEG